MTVDGGLRASVCVNNNDKKQKQTTKPRNSHAPRLSTFFSSLSIQLFLSAFSLPSLRRYFSSPLVTLSLFQRCFEHHRPTAKRAVFIFFFFLYKLDFRRRFIVIRLPIKPYAFPENRYDIGFGRPDR